MSSPILVTGGTGTLGRHVVRRLHEAGCEVRVLSRRAQPAADGIEVVSGDLRTGAGVVRAVTGADVIVHCATSTNGDADTTANLLEAAASQPEPPHLVYISIVGVDHVPFGYTRAKLRCEQIIADSRLPWTVLRATQFYDLVFQGARSLAKLPLVPVPASFPVQPVDADEVAARLVELALGRPAGRMPDMGGPEVITFADLIRRYLRVLGRSRAVLPVPLPGTRAIRAGALLASQDGGAGGLAGKVTWEEFLAEKFPEGEISRREA